MSRTVFLFFLLSVSPLGIVSLQCYTCDTPFTLNYTVTSDTVPSFTNCRLINGTQCTLSVIWLQKPAQSFIRLGYRTVPLTNDTLHYYILAMAQMEVIHDKEIPLVAHDLQFGCISWDKCNDEMSLKRILHSLVIKDKFAEEFSSLIQVHSFNKELAATCYEFNNSTDDCSPTNLDVCQRCQIFIDKWSSSSQQICATCPHDFVGINWLIRESIFLLNNRTQLIDRAQLKCQLKRCNSIYNANQIYKASSITFNFGEFFKNSSDDVN